MCRLDYINAYTALEDHINHAFVFALAVDPQALTFFSYLSQKRGPFSTSPLALQFDRLNRAYWAYRDLAAAYPWA